MSAPTRLRQIVLVAESLDPVTQELKSRLGLADGFNDPGVAAATIYLPEATEGTVGIGGVAFTVVRTS